MISRDISSLKHYLTLDPGLINLGMFSYSDYLCSPQSEFELKLVAFCLFDLDAFVFTKVSELKPRGNYSSSLLGDFANL